LEELAREVEGRLDRKIDRLQRLVDAADEYFGGGHSGSDGVRTRPRIPEAGREAPLVSAPWKGEATLRGRPPGLSSSERRRTEVGGAASPPADRRQEADAGAAAGRHDALSQPAPRQPAIRQQGHAEGEPRVGALEITQEERDLVLSLAAGGKSPETISDTLGLHRGEVDLILRLFRR
jgi:hypothetical protein